MPDVAVAFQFKVPGQQPLAMALQRFAANISDFTTYFNDYLLPAWYAHMEDVYATEGSASGQRWAPLTAAYAAWKIKHFPGMPIGVLSGATMNALTSATDANTILNISKRQMVVGTSMPYALYLQLGTRRMKARPPLRLTEDFAITAGKLLQEFGHAAEKA